MRLHPEQKTDGIPVIVPAAADFEMLASAGAGPGPLAPASASSMVMGRSNAGFRAVHQQDVIGRKGACLFLSNVLAAWNAHEHPRPQFFRRLSIIPGCLPENNQDCWSYHLYLNSVPWGQAWLRQGVREFAVCWLEDVSRAGFYVCLEGGTTYRVDPASNKAPYQEGTEFVSWQ